MQHLQTRQLIRELAKEFGLSIVEVTAILNSVPEFTKHIMVTEVDKEEGIYPSIRIPGWGIFYVPEGVKKNVKTALEKRKNKDESI
jgi:hypothetical protein